MSLPGLPTTEPGDGFAMPVMRGFACPVVTPYMGGADGPSEGVGVGWSNVAGHGVKFFVSVHAEGGFAMVAQLDYARYQRLCFLLASVGKQAMLGGHLEEVSENDTLHALGMAHDALAAGLGDLDVNAPAWQKMNEARETVAKALMIHPKGSPHE